MNFQQIADAKHNLQRENNDKHVKNFKNSECGANYNLEVFLQTFPFFYTTLLVCDFHWLEVNGDGNDNIECN